MDQIYYTQCPIGYGLGASNGFQIKRVTPGYPLDGDFRHLGVRAFPAGGRSLAPATLRYRRVAGLAELIRLTPRPFEYETERGLWGRPGGHLAHGVLLTSDELRALDDWPAGLIDAPGWRRTDPEPTRGRPPDPVAFGRADRAVSPRLPDLIALADGLESATVARLLTALATVVRDGRTLVLIDEPDRLSRRVAFLTALIPPPLRADLTFSTYHDRPEDLPGYAIQGTTPANRPNRPMLRNQGIIADLMTSQFEPDVEPGRWATRLVGWLERPDDGDWDRFAERIGPIAASIGDRAWLDASLNRLIDLDEATRHPSTTPDWSAEAALAGFVAGTGLAAEWATSRGPAWWATLGPLPTEGRAALVGLVGWPEAWAAASGSLWGETIGRAFAEAEPTESALAAATVVKAAPASARFGLVRSLLQALPAGSGGAVRVRLERTFASDPKTLALWSLPDAVRAAEAGRRGPLTEAVRRFVRAGGAVVTALEAIRDDLDNDPDRIRSVAPALDDLLDDLDAIAWAVRQGDHAFAWLADRVHRRLAIPDDLDGWRTLVGSIPSELGPGLAAVVIRVAASPGLSARPFVWAIEELVLGGTIEGLATEPGWAARYLDGSESDLALMTSLYARPSRTAGLRAWVEAARGRGDLRPDHLARLAHLTTLARALDGRNPGPIAAIDLGRVPGCDRGPLLGRLLRRGGSDPVDLLTRAGLAWPESLRPGSADLPAIARAVAASHPLQAARSDASTWYLRLAEFSRLLDPATAGPYGPAGMVAEVVAARASADETPTEVWAIRNLLANDEAGWRSIGRDLSICLLAREPDDAAEVISEWDRRISKSRSDRFWEVVLNSCDGRRLAVVVARFAEALGSLGPLGWWDCTSQASAVNDLRDAYARTIPLAPIDDDRLHAVQNWMDRHKASEPIVRGERPWLSPLGLARWTVLDRLSKDLFRPGLDDRSRQIQIGQWPTNLPLADLPIDDRHRLLAWAIWKLAETSDLNIDRFAFWLVKSGLTDLDRVVAWPRELAGLVDDDPSATRARSGFVRDLRAEMERVIRDRMG